MGKFSVNSIRGNENGKVRLGEGLLNETRLEKTQAITIALMTLIHLPNQ